MSWRNRISHWVNVIVDICLCIHIFLIVIMWLYVWNNQPEFFQSTQFFVTMIIWLLIIIATSIANRDSKRMLREHLQRMKELDDFGDAIKEYRRKHKIPYFDARGNPIDKIDIDGLPSEQRSA